jgi:hypothetical protein
MYEGLMLCSWTFPRFLDSKISLQVVGALMAATMHGRIYSSLRHFHWHRYDYLQSVRAEIPQMDTLTSFFIAEIPQMDTLTSFFIPFAPA